MRAKIKDTQPHLNLSTRSKKHCHSIKTNRSTNKFAPKKFEFAKIHLICDRLSCGASYRGLHLCVYCRYVSTILAPFRHGLERWVEFVGWTRFRSLASSAHVCQPLGWLPMRDGCSLTQRGWTRKARAPWSWGWFLVHLVCGLLLGTSIGSMWANRLRSCWWKRRTNKGSVWHTLLEGHRRPGALQMRKGSLQARQRRCFPSEMWDASRVPLPPAPPVPALPLLL